MTLHDHAADEFANDASAGGCENAQSTASVPNAAIAMAQPALLETRVRAALDLTAAAGPSLGRSARRRSTLRSHSSRWEERASPRRGPIRSRMPLLSVRNLRQRSWRIRRFRGPTIADNSAYGAEAAGAGSVAGDVAGDAPRGARNWLGRACAGSRSASSALTAAARSRSDSMSRCASGSETREQSP